MWFKVLLSEKVKEFENIEAELRRHMEDLQTKYRDARDEIEAYQQR